MILSIAGRPEYVSPEMMRLQPYNEQTDMFSLGLVIFECLFQRHPLYAETIPEVQQNILHKTIVLTEEERESKSEEILNFMF